MWTMQFFCISWKDQNEKEKERRREREGGKGRERNNGNLWLWQELWNDERRKVLLIFITSGWNNLYRNMFQYKALLHWVSHCDLSFQCHIESGYPYDMLINIPWKVLNSIYEKWSPDPWQVLACADYTTNYQQSRSISESIVWITVSKMETKKAGCFLNRSIWSRPFEKRRHKMTNTGE